ncbi:MAG TPA: proline dehydrogenase family protein [Candidatus Acidoferrales bacterium]|nr:proline dehydrogenase family protein [Candidatus Acidoferrales bacterium]
MMRNVIFWLSTKKSVTGALAERGMRYGFARRFVAGESLEEALAASKELNRESRSVSLNHLGENVSTPAEAGAVKDGYISMIRALDRDKLDGNISIKLTQLGLDFDAGLCQAFSREIAAAAAEIGSGVEMDMEASGYVAKTLDIFEAVQREFTATGLAIQAYLHRTAEDIERLAPLKPKLRLVKGAYREPANVAEQKKPVVDENYKKFTETLLDGRFFPAIASHDVAMLDHARSVIRERKIPADKYEFQMIYGIRRDLQAQIRSEGHHLRIYVPFGTEWCPYFMRRLSERPANCLFVVRNLVAESFKAHNAAPSPHA